MRFVASYYNILLNNKHKGPVQIYNSFSKARIEIEDAYYIDVLTGKTPIDVNSLENFDILLKNGFIVQEDLDEKLALKYVFQKRFFDNTGLNLILMPTLACNFSCPYCFENETRTQFKTNPNYFGALKKHIILQKRKYSQIHLGLFGGEPLLMKKELFSFIDWVKKFTKENKIYYDTSILTNGALIDEEIVSFLSKNNCQYLQITIDGSEKEHDKSRCFSDGKPSFKLLMAKMQLCAKLLENNDTCRLTLRINLNNNTLEDIKETLNYIEPKFRRRIQLLFRAVFKTKKYDMHNDNNSKDLEKYISLGSAMGYKILKNENVFSSCEGCSDINVFHVLPDLSLWKCVIDLSYQDACLGQMSDKGEITWDMEKVLSWYGCCDFTYDAECVNCKFSPDCLGGCVKHRRQYGERSCQPFDLRAEAYKYC